MDRRSIGRRIQSYREIVKMSQEELAEILDLSPNYISAIERGIKTPSLEVFVKIANALQVSADPLLEEVLINGYQIKTSLLTEKLETLSAQEREQALLVLETIIKKCVQL